MTTGSSKSSQSVGSVVGCSGNVTKERRDSNIGRHVPKARRYLRSLVQFQQRAAICVVYRPGIETTARALADVSSMPHGDGVALDELTNCRADGFDEMIARSQSVGAGQETMLLDSMPSEQSVVGMHDIPGNPTGLAREKIVSLDPFYSGSVGQRNLAGERAGAHHAGVRRQLQKTRIHGISRGLFGVK